ncbi:type II toxin-antitoxin system MqsA family antitoxin [Agrobacterium rubi]|uniref:type II toxin-antitoxin system MqsA family antitoxin n=1 Tax=Agrobacterium TaxID=357 RepID=UPI0015736EE7|nr:MULTISPECIES: type II toxin-antitoxin system MqsA family antitoxin [Agrobacterium]NTF06835.1 type II toxin-antitoxin system MqsA family antitoxin [Agrobacterium rubi]NTF19077.1 type II toxin-antitoxin system MqsA family antitoxin [Agrobacterium rubi]NTF26040.1 type II toxin-antitoxin system MqsA family antitoxin [Agrobacterium rubi]UHS56003.1 type II toxin-antitoxin system MqsA family antitoxin [Agrobacterium vaccinii]
MSDICMCCDSGARMNAFSNETHRIEHRGLAVEVDGLSGVRCPTCGEIEYHAQSAERYATASDSLVLEARRTTGDELRRIRKKLGINQAEASKLTGGGHNAFSRYETGKVTPTPAVINLFRMLEKHPEEVEELKRA